MLGRGGYTLPAGYVPTSGLGGAAGSGMLSDSLSMGYSSNTSLAGSKMLGDFKFDESSAAGSRLAAAALLAAGVAMLVL